MDENVQRRQAYAFAWSSGLFRPDICGSASGRVWRFALTDCAVVSQTADVHDVMDTDWPAVRNTRSIQAQAPG